MNVPARDKIVVLLQFLLLFAWFLKVQALQFRLPENIRYIALIVAGTGFILLSVACFQLGRNLSPFPAPAKRATLCTSGAFTFARHPIYAGILFLGFGIGFWLGSGYKLIVTCGLWGLFYLKSLWEEKALKAHFPGYNAYKMQTGRFFPKFSWRI